MKNKRITTVKPVLVVMMGLPGAGKTHTAAQLAESLNAFHIEGDELRSELFEEPERTEAQDNVVERLVSLLTEKFMGKKFNLVVDSNFERRGLRRRLKSVCKAAGYGLLFVWIQTDVDTSFYRAANRDRRRQDDKYAVKLEEDSFKRLMHQFQPPQHEDYVVVSGKHIFRTQLASIEKKLNELGLLRVRESNDTFTPRPTQVKSTRQVGSRRRLTI